MFELLPYFALYTILFFTLFQLVFFVVSLGLAFLLRKIIEKRSRKKRSKNFIPLATFILFILVNILSLTPGIVEKFLKETFKIPKESNNIKITSVEKRYDDSKTEISFYITIDQSGDYLFMPSIYPCCHKLVSFNGEDQTSKNTLPLLFIEQNNPTRIELLFSRENSDPPKSFKVQISPKTQSVNFDGWGRIVFSGQSENLREMAWLGHYDKKAAYIYLSNFDFD